jgi:hypothetical protein
MGEPARKAHDAHMSGTSHQGDKTYGWGAPAIALISVLSLLVAGVFAASTKDQNLLLLIVGAIIANSSSAVQYYLGSSSSSSSKDALLATQLPQRPVTPPVIVTPSTSIPVAGVTPPTP